MIKNYVELLKYYVENYENEVMLEYIEEDRIGKITYGEFYRKVKTISDFLKNENLQNTKIALLMDNCYQWFIYHYAILASNNVAVLIPKESGIEACNRMLKKTDTKVIITDVEGRIDADKIIKSDKVIEGTEGAISAIDSEYEGLANIIFTSGTSGVEKAVCLSNKNCLYPVNSSMKNQATGNDKERRMFALPLAHVGGVCSAVTFASGSSCCLLEDAKYFLKYLKMYEPTHLSITPMFLRLIIKKLKTMSKEKVVGRNLKSIVCACAILPEDEIKLITGSGITIVDTYGMSETTGMGAYKVYVGNTDMIVGGRYSDINVEIIDGEVVISGDNIMLGYYNDEEETRKVLVDGKVYTGDLGYFEENGTLKIVGRKKNLIILSNGENISPEEIENIFLRTNLIDECIVYGKDDKIWIDIVKNNKATEEEIKGFIEEYNKSSRFNRRIQKILFVTEIEKNATGKVKRNK